ncbi:hypothetical protein VVD49_02675 [Uliginosibacterium sp. H3]|uniref:DUF302 domain-containing protein n=1 Tax=Uliginosibacterium silvisoli TaxID=3114758 RepID=A0ABU6JZK8_9RHOO|nr:hypothetical protein [Uliginosibacterium sp. H3]
MHVSRRQACFFIAASCAAALTGCAAHNGRKLVEPPAPVTGMSVMIEANAPIAWHDVAEKEHAGLDKVVQLFMAELGKNIAPGFAGTSIPVKLRIPGAALPPELPYVLVIKPVDADVILNGGKIAGLRTIDLDVSLVHIAQKLPVWHYKTLLDGNPKRPMTPQVQAIADAMIDQGLIPAAAR